MINNDHWSDPCDRKYVEIFRRLETLSPEQKVHTLRWLCTNDLYFLCKAILGFFWLTGPAHQEFAADVQLDIAYSWYLLPRGHCKTQIFSIGDTIRNYLIDPLGAIGLGCDIQKRAIKKLRAVKWQFHYNTKLRTLWPDRVWENPKRDASKWTDEEIILPGHDGRQEASITAFGVNSLPTGSHFTRIKFDDLVTPENTTTRDLMNKTEDDYAMVRSSILQSGGNLQGTGTIYDDADLHRTIEDSGLTSEQYDPDKHKNIYRVYKRPAIYEERNEEGKLVKKPLWPEQYGFEILDAIKNDPTVGTYIFSCQYLLDPVPDDEHAFFNLKAFGRHSEVPADVEYYSSIDFAIGEKDVDAYTAIDTVALDENNELYIVDVRRGRWDALEIIQNMLDVQSEYNPLLFTAEDDLIKKTLLPFLSLKMRETGVFINLDPRIPHKDKVARARSIQGRVKEGAVSLPARGPNQPDWLKDFEHELTRFPRGRNKDQVDALAWIGIQLDDHGSPYGKRRPFHMFGSKNLGNPLFDELVPSWCSLLFPGNNPFYALWGQEVWIKGVKTLQLLDEFVMPEAEGSIPGFVDKLTKWRKNQKANVLHYICDEESRGRSKGDHAINWAWQVSSLGLELFFSRTTLPVRTATLREALASDKPFISVHRGNCPLLVRAMTSARWADVKANTIEWSPHVYPVAALQQMLEFIIAEKVAVGY